ncbi:MAG: hypothetical protein DWQ19_11915 [Crenarchaeota archaeon]|nr:MAG: hypothetical protein DWQ19_11915 [Thermoproteota archaeon]
MSRIIYLTISFLLVFFILHAFLTPNPETTKPLYLKPEQLSEPIDSTDNNILLEMNCRNAMIKNIRYPEIIMQTDDVILGSQLKATLAYEKKLNFRMLIYSFLGEESDIGSNSEIFWFWSKRMRPQALYYAKHEDLHKTRLKTPFHPMWMKEIIGVNEIDLNGALVFKQGELIIVSQRKFSVMGHPIIRIYVIDPVKLAFLGHYIYNLDGSLVVSAEVLNHYKINDYYVPKIIQIYWAEENLKSKWIMQCPILNGPIDASNWECKDFEYKINLDGYIPTKSFLIF